MSEETSIWKHIHFDRKDFLNSTSNNEDVESGQNNSRQRGIETDKASRHVSWPANNRGYNIYQGQTRSTLKLITAVER